jgi:hypothetical protein
MAIITDPDNLDRFQVLVDYENELVSIRAVETQTAIVAPSTGGIQRSGENALYDFVGNKNFSTSGVGGVGVRSGDILVAVDGPNINHWPVTGLDGTTGIFVDPTTLGTFNSYVTNGINGPTFTGSYAVFSGVNGSVTDGATLQALYSFLKEEWKTQGVSGEVTLTDLIQFIFPLESITREQFEIGGPTHSLWDWKDDTTRNLIRTAGWNRVSGDGTVLSQYAGIITLGSLDTDTQVYYQQVDSASGTPTDPKNFVLLGSVNQAILFNTDGGEDNSSYLKLFARKKARSYPTSEIADIGVASLENIVNRFPLAHVNDPAIVETDGTLAIIAPWQSGDLVFGDTDGSTSAQDSSQQEQTFTFTSAGSDFFASGIRPKDALGTGSAVGASTDDLFEIVTVGTTTLTCLQEPGVSIPALGSIPFNVRSRIRGVGPAGGGASTGDAGQAEDLNTATGNFFSVGATFSTDGVVANDILAILDQATDEPVGTYKIISVASETGLVVNTSDQDWTAGPYNSSTFEVYKKGMFLQYKSEQATTIPAAAHEINFNGTQIIGEVSTMNFADSGYVVGGVVRVGSAEDSANNGSYTITGITTTTNTNDTLLTDNTFTSNNADTSAALSGENGFIRSPQNTSYSYNWRLFGNDGTLAQCFQWIQKALRRGAGTVLNDSLGHNLADIDTASGVFRGDVTDLLMSFASPNGTTLNMFIDDLASTDSNNVTFEDILGVGRNFAFISTIIISVNDNLISDSSSKLTVFFTNDDAGDNLGRDYDTENAIIVQTDTGSNMVSNNIAGDKNVDDQIQYSFDYDNNTQRGTASAATDAPVTIVAIGTSGAQWVRTAGTVVRENTNTFSLVANLERNYSNP